jgi:O-antigen ligase
MIIPLSIGLIIAHIDIISMAGLSWQERFLKLSEKRVSIHLSLILGVVIMSLGIVFSKSRSGIFLLVFGFILFLGMTLLFFESSRVKKKWTGNLLLAIFLIIVIISLQIGISASLERFAMDKLLREGRPSYWANTLDIFAQSPLFGVGLGTFPSIYPDEEVGDVPMSIYHAHNDYLEYLAELGLVGFGFLLGGILFILGISFKAWRSRNYSESVGLTLGGIVGIVCIMIHSITDFNLHIPANMLLFSVVLSLTLVVAFYRKGESEINVHKTEEVQERLREFVIVQPDEPT